MDSSCVVKQELSVIWFKAKLVITYHSVSAAVAYHHHALILPMVVIEFSTLQIINSVNIYMKQSKGWHHNSNRNMLSQGHKRNRNKGRVASQNAFRYKLRAYHYHRQVNTNTKNPMQTKNWKSKQYIPSQKLQMKCAIANMNEIIPWHFNWTTYITETLMLNHIHNNHLHNTDDGGQAMAEELRHVQMKHAHRWKK